MIRLLATSWRSRWRCRPAPRARRRARPGRAGPDPTAIDAFTTATAACRGFRSMTGELSLSGRAAGERIRGRVIAGLESGGSVRLEGVAPFGPPVFILAGKAETGHAAVAARASRA